MTTYCALSLFGVAAEANPLFRWLLAHCGVLPTFVLNGLIYSLVIGWVYQVKRTKLLTALLVLMVLVVVSNLIQCGIGWFYG